MSFESSSDEMQAGGCSAPPPYDDLYRARLGNRLWGDAPGRLLPRLCKLTRSGVVLDAGCGDGKNALYLETLGYDVTGFDLSELALKGLYNRFKDNGLRPRGSYYVADATSFRSIRSFDILISYGLFHCMNKTNRIDAHLRIQNSLMTGGRVAFTCLTDQIPLPDNHSTQGVELVSIEEVDMLFWDWHIEYKEVGTIEEDHLPLVDVHQHSAVWLIARRVG